jgi:tRNA (guanine-N7-)-methyltransferase
MTGRGIRSYVLRRSHFSTAQRDAYERLMPLYGVAFSEAPLDFATLFGRDAPTILEIGFGMGDTTATIAADHPDRNYLGIEVHTPGVGALLKLLEARRLRNVRVIEHDAQAVVQYQVPDESLTGIHVFFPDPWPKARHHKRRLIQQQFVTLLTGKLRSGGYLHLATDWPDYAAQMIEAVDATPGLAMMASPGPRPPGDGEAASLPPSRPLTKFEQRGLRLGHPITDVMRVKRER